MRRLACLLLAALLLGCDRPEPTTAESLGQVLGGEASGFARAEAPRRFVFPDDHGPHPDYRTEWWYYTGNLATTDGRRFGFQLTFFRYALVPGEPAGESAWRSHQVYMAHFALTDVQSGRFLAEERFARATLGLAGAQATPFAVWLENWEAKAAQPGAAWPVQLEADSDNMALALTLSPLKPIVLQGEAGLSRKSTEPGNASYYYSASRLEAIGSLRIGDEVFKVTGSAWLDREWSTSALAADQAGWDWFALQFDNGSELMYYQLRRKEGGADPASAGSLIRPDGSKRALDADAVYIEVTDYWQSPNGGSYPSGWRLRVPSADLALTVEPLTANQELDFSVRYWEGAVAVSGTQAGRPVEGYGYVELTGYADSAR